jgi:hypothetical protein
MTTVVDPSGTPVPVYNRSGTTIVEVIAGSISPVNLQTPIPHHSGTTIVLVTSNATNNETGVELPDGADAGDLVEIHSVSGGAGVTVYRSPDGTMHGATNAQKGIGDGTARVFRKVSATDWRMIGG